VFATSSLLERNGMRGQFVALRGQQLSLKIEFVEYIDFAAQDIRFDRFLNEVDSPSLVTLEPPGSVDGTSGDKDDGYATTSFVPAHELSEFIAAEARHLNVDERQSNVVLQKQFQCLVARARPEEQQVIALQQRVEGKQVFLE